MPPKKTQEKKADAAATASATSKPKPTDNAPAATSGHATKPDQDAYKAEQDAIRAEIDSLQARLVSQHSPRAIPVCYNLLNNPADYREGQDCTQHQGWPSRRQVSRLSCRHTLDRGLVLSMQFRRAALRAELDELRSSQGSNKASRDKLLEDIKAIQESTSKRVR